MGFLEQRVADMFCSTERELAGRGESSIRDFIPDTSERRIALLKLDFFAAGTISRLRIDDIEKMTVSEVLALLRLRLRDELESCGG